MIFVTVPLPGLKRETVASGVFVTQTLPAPTATAAGPLPIEIALVTPLPAASTSTSCPAEVVTQTPSRPTASPDGVPASGIVAAVPVAGSMREIVPSLVFATQSDP
jgi:hypothetical protein